MNSRFFFRHLLALVAMAFACAPARKDQNKLNASGVLVHSDPYQNAEQIIQTLPKDQGDCSKGRESYLHAEKKSFVATY